MPTNCPNCQKTLPPNAKFCGYCGTVLTPTPAPASRPAQSNPVSLPLLIGVIAIPLLLCGIVGAIALARMPNGPLTALSQWLDHPTPVPDVQDPTFEAGSMGQNGKGATPVPIKVDPPAQIDPPPTTNQPPENPPAENPPAVDPMPDPVDFIRAYYGAINNRDYASAWAHLTQNFIDQKSEKLGRPYTYQEDYAAYWDTVERMDVLEASVESQDAQSAVLLLKLRWNMVSGVAPVYNHRFTLVKDPNSSTWLIDATETWK